MVRLERLARAAVSDDAAAPRAAALVGGLVLVLMWAPLAVGYNISTPAWDELFFLHNAVCVNHAVFSGSLHELDLCLGAMAKSPIMAALLIPAGPLNGSISKLSSAPVVLALLTFSQIILLAVLTWRVRIPPLAIIIAAVSVFFTPALMQGGAPLLVDDLLAVTILNTLMLLAVECDLPTHGLVPSIGRGIFWGVVGSIGLLSKLTYLLFAALVFVPAVIISLRRSGIVATAVKLLAALGIGLGAILVTLRYGQGYYAHAAAAAFGDLAQYYNDGLTRLAFLRSVEGSIRPLWIAVIILGCWAFWPGRISRERAMISIYLLSIMLLYLFVASGSQNRDPRFFWPIWLAIPFCLAIAVPPMKASDRTVAASMVVVPAIVALALSFAMLGRFDFSAVALAQRVLDLLPGNRPINVIIVTDEGTFNIETLILAKRLGGSLHANKTIDTAVYDIVRNLSVADSIERLREADYAIAREPLPVAAAPEWTNRFHQQFLAALQESDRVVATLQGNPNTIIFAKPTP